MMLCFFSCMIFCWNCEFIYTKLVHFNDDTINLYGCSVMPEDAEWEQYYLESSVLNNPLDYSIAPFKDREDDVQFIYLTQDLNNPVKLFIETYSRSVLVTFSDGEINWKDCAFEPLDKCVEKQKFTPTFSSNINIQGCFCIAEDEARIMFGIAGISGDKKMEITETFFITEDQHPEEFLNFYFDLGNGTESSKSVPRIYVQGRHRYMNRKDISRPFLQYESINKLSTITVGKNINELVIGTIQNGDVKSVLLNDEVNFEYSTTTDSKVSEQLNKSRSGQIVENKFDSALQDDESKNNEEMINGSSSDYQTNEFRIFEKVNEGNNEQMMEGLANSTNRDVELKSRSSTTKSKLLEELKNSVSESAMSDTLVPKWQEDELNGSRSIIVKILESQTTKQPKTFESLNKNIGKQVTEDIAESVHHDDEQINSWPVIDSYSESKTTNKLSNNFDDQIMRESFKDLTFKENEYKSTLSISDRRVEFKTPTAYPENIEKAIGRKYMNDTFDPGNLNQKGVLTGNKYSSDEGTFNRSKVEGYYAARGRSAVNVNKEIFQNISEENNLGMTSKDFVKSTFESTMESISDISKIMDSVMVVSTTQILTTLTADATNVTSLKKLITTMASTKRSLPTTTTRITLSTFITTIPNFLPTRMYIPPNPQWLQPTLMSGPLPLIKMRLTQLPLIDKAANPVPSNSTIKIPISMLYEDVRELPPIGWVPPLTFLNYDN